MPTQSSLPVSVLYHSGGVLSSCSCLNPAPLPAGDSQKFLVSLLWAITIMQLMVPINLQRKPINDFTKEPFYLISSPTSQLHHYRNALLQWSKRRQQRGEKNRENQDQQTSSPQVSQASLEANHCQYPWHWREGSSLHQQTSTVHIVDKSIDNTLGPLCPWQSCKNSVKISENNKFLPHLLYSIETSSYLLESLEEISLDFRVWMIHLKDNSHLPIIQ